MFRWLKYKYNLKTPGGGVNNLGFLFYPFLDVPLFLLSSGQILGSPAYAALTNVMSENVLTGPVSTEILFKNAKLQKTRKQFYLPSGKAWHGPHRVSRLHPTRTGCWYRSFCLDGKSPTGHQTTPSLGRGWPRNRCAWQSPPYPR